MVKSCPWGCITMGCINPLTVFVCVSLCVRFSGANVVPWAHEEVTEPMAVDGQMEDVITVTFQPMVSEEPERAGFRGWNREQVLSYMSESEDDTSEPGQSASIVTEESMKLRRLAEIQLHILQALGITDPQAYSTPKLSEEQEQELISTLNRTQPSNDRSNMVKTFECMVAACEMPLNQSLHVRNNANARSMQLYFDTNFWDDNRRITHGVLKLRLNDEDYRGRRQSRNAGDSRLEVRVYRYLSTRKANGRPRKLVVDAKIISRTAQRWVLLNIKSAIKYWRRSPEENYGLEVVVRNTNEQRLDANRLFVGLNCSHDETNLCLPAHSEDEAIGVPQALPDSENSMAPNLHVVTMEKEFMREEFTLTRRRRDLTSDSPCFMEPFLVSLADLGWDNLTFTPNVVEAGLCIGNCTSDDLEQGSEFCSKCVPTKMGSVTLAFKDNRGNTGSGSVKNLVVEECGLSDKM